MRKPHEFNEMSDVLCSNPPCGNRIKANVIARTPEGRPITCWKCHVKETRGQSLGEYKKYRKARVQAIAEESDPRAVTAAA